MLENFSRLYKQGARALQTDDRQTTDGRAIAYSEREREFTFAKMGVVLCQARNESQRTVLMGYFNISTNVRSCQTLSQMTFFLSERAHLCTVCMQRSPTPAFC